MNTKTNKHPAGQGLYTSEQFKVIFAALGTLKEPTYDARGELEYGTTPEKIGTDLNGYAADLIFESLIGNPPQPSSLDDRLKAVGDRAEGLFQMLTSGDAFQLQDQLQRAAKGGADISQIVEGVRRLAQLARDAQQVQSKKAAVNASTAIRRAGLTPNTVFVHRLASIWVDATGDLPGTTYRHLDHRTSGRFIDFVMACHKPPQSKYREIPELTSHAVRAILSRQRAARGKTPERQREAIEKGKEWEKRYGAKNRALRLKRAAAG